MTNLNATVATVLVMLAFLAGQSVAGRYYYDKVQDKVRKEVEKAMAKNPSVGPALVRLVFHDCWVYVSIDMLPLLECLIYKYNIRSHPRIQSSSDDRQCLILGL